MAAVSCSPGVYKLPATGLGIWLTGKLGCAWVGARVGAWHGCMGAWCGWCGDGGGVVMFGGVGKLHVYTTWIGEVGLGHWGRSGW